MFGPQILDQGLYWAQWCVRTPQEHVYTLYEWICLALFDFEADQSWLSRARSLRLRCTSGSYASGDGTVNSPARRKPKKPTALGCQAVLAICPAASSV